MKDSLYRSLAKSTIKRHKNLYLPFIVNGIFLLIISIICLTMSSEQILKRKFITNISSLAFWIMLIFSAIIILSTYNFIQKKKYEENGLYMVLGMERKHIIKIMFWEIIYVASRVILIGCILGFVIYKISLASYMHMINLNTDIFKDGIFQNPFSTIMAGAIFLLIYLLLFAVNSIKIRKLSAIDLMRESKSGDKKSRFKGLTAVFGLLCLAGGYYISLTTKDPMKAISNLFIAVILVIIGTYLAFSVIISTVLAILKRNKDFYYKKENFAAISGLMYRVRNSSRSLAGITILSTSVMVILTSGLSLYLGTGEKINNISPYDYTIYSDYMDTDKDINLERVVEDFLKENKLQAKTDAYKKYITLAFKDGGNITPLAKDAQVGDFSNYGSFVNVSIIYTDRHDDVFKESKVIEVPNESSPKQIKIEKYDEKVVSKDYKDLDFKFSRPMNIIDSYYLLTDDMNEFNKLLNLIKSENDMAFSSYQETLQVNEEDKSKKWNSFEKDITNYLSTKGLDHTSVASRDAQIEEETQANSSIFFMGILLGLAFLVSTALFIYFKQLS